MQAKEYRLNQQRVVIAADADALYQIAVNRIIETAHAAVRDRGAFHLALSGGSTPRRLHQLLAEPMNQQQIEWNKVHVYFGDERNVPHDHPDSNFRMAMETLLTRVPVPPSQIHGMPTGCDDMQACADRYAQVLETLPQRYGLPCFDLILLGMGDDGHTASLFPGTSILSEQHRTVAAVYVPKLSCWRISLTYPVINQANVIMELVSGESKSDMLFKVMNEPVHEFPIQGINKEHLEWYVDTSAARRLVESDVGISG